MEYLGYSIPVILTGVTKLLVMSGVPKKIAPIFTLVFGVLAGISMNRDVRDGVFLGVVYALIATGLYSGVKNVKQYVE